MDYINLRDEKTYFKVVENENNMIIKLYSNGAQVSFVNGKDECEIRKKVLNYIEFANNPEAKKIWNLFLEYIEESF